MRLQRGTSGSAFNERLEETRIRSVVKHEDKRAARIAEAEMSQQDLILQQARLSNIIAGISVTDDPELRGLLRRKAEEELWKLV